MKATLVFQLSRGRAGVRCRSQRAEVQEQARRRMGQAIPAILQARLPGATLGGPQHLHTQRQHGGHRDAGRPLPGNREGRMMNCTVCGRPATHVAFAGFDVYGCALCPASDINPPVVIANSLTAKRAAASSGGPVLGNEMAFEEMKARYAAVKSEAERDYEGMRDFQQKYIRAEQERRAAIDDVEWVLERFVAMAKKYEPDNAELHYWLANRMKN